MITKYIGVYEYRIYYMFKYFKNRIPKYTFLESLIMWEENLTYLNTFPLSYPQFVIQFRVIFINSKRTYLKCQWHIPA